MLRKFGFRILVLYFALAVLAGSFAFAQQPPAQQQPANAAGKWTLYCKDPNGSTSTKYLELEQKGNVITGHFKGPNQSGWRRRHNRRTTSRRSYQDARCSDVSRTGRRTAR